MSLKEKSKTLKREDNKCVIYLQLTHESRIKLISTGLKIYPWQWDSNHMCIVSGVSDISEKAQSFLDSKIKNMGKKQVASEMEYDCFTQALSCEENDKESLLFFEFMNDLINRLEISGCYRTAQTYKCTYRSFSRFLKKHDICFEKLNADLLKKYERYLKDRGLTLNSISFYMRILRAVYNKAIENYQINKKNLFKHVYTGIEKTRKRAVDEGVISQLKKLDLENKPGLALARDLFLFSFYTRGMSFIDMAYLRKRNIKNGFIYYNRQKTGQQLRIRIEPCIQEIINRYVSVMENSDFILPIIRKNDNEISSKKYLNAISYQNKQLKIISRMLNLPINLTTYVARHTWATAAKKKNIPISIISEGMGHNNESTTQIYLASLDQAMIDNANHKILCEL